MRRKLEWKDGVLTRALRNGGQFGPAEVDEVNSRRYQDLAETEADGTSERVPEVCDQDDTPLLGCNVTHPRHGHNTEYERPAYKRGRRIGKWLPWLLLAVGAVIWLIICVIPW